MAKISVITVSYNAAATIEQTILSVVGQNYPNIEYIIIDGGSTDDTVDIIRKYEARIACWVSEPDNGIYDAMNKGIRRAAGEYVYFLGADDWLRDERVLQDVSDFIRVHPGYDFYVGYVFLYRAALGLTKRQRIEPSVETLKSGAMWPHQGLFTRRDLLISGFDPRYRVAADYAFLLRYVTAGASFCVMDIGVAYYALFGASDDEAVYDEYISIIKDYAGEAYLPRICQLKKRAKEQRSWRKIIKKVAVALLGEKRFFRLRGWKECRSVK